MEFITEFVAIGNVDDAKDVVLLKKAKIKGVVSVTKRVHVPLEEYKKARIHWKHWAIADSEPLPKEKNQEFFAVMGFIDKMVHSKKRCFVHCQAGVSRSPSVLAAWLHMRKGMSWEEALSLIQSVRPIVKPNPEPFASIRKLVDAVMEGVFI